MPANGWSRKAIILVSQGNVHLVSFSSKCPHAAGKATIVSGRIIGKSLVVIHSTLLCRAGAGRRHGQKATRSLAVADSEEAMQLQVMRLKKVTDSVKG